jgi:hypothetical protein
VCAGCSRQQSQDLFKTTANAFVASVCLSWGLEAAATADDEGQYAGAVQLAGKREQKRENVNKTARRIYICNAYLPSSGDSPWGF